MIKDQNHRGAFRNIKRFGVPRGTALGPLLLYYIKILLIYRVNSFNFIYIRFYESVSMYVFNIFVHYCQFL